MVEAVRVPAHLVPPWSPKAKWLHHLHAQLSLGQSCHRQKKSYVYVHRVTSVMSDSLWRCRLWPARLLCHGRGFSRARILECIDQCWLSCTSRALYFLLHYPPTPLSTWCCQNLSDPSSCTISTAGPHRGKPKSSRAASGANSNGWPTCRGGNKITAETQGQCG